MIRSAAIAMLFLAMAGVAQEMPDQVYVFGTTVVIPAGLQGTIHFIHSPTKLATLEKEKPRGTIYTTALNVPPQDYTKGFPGITNRLEWFAIDYSGRFWVESPGLYKWELTSDDGSMLFIDGQLVIDNGGEHAPVTLTGTSELTRGVHAIRVPYFQGRKYHVALVLKVAPPGQQLRVFNTDDFKAPPDADVPPPPPVKASKKK